MKIAINPEIEPKIGYARIEGVTVRKECHELELLKKQVEAELAQRYAGADIATIPQIANWRRVYSDFGYKPSKHRCTIEALLRRIVKGGGLPTVNTVVDSCNVTIVRNLCSMGAYDANKLKGEMELRYSRAGELYRDIGDGTARPTEAGIIVFVDNNGIICRGFNYRDSEWTKVDENTKDVVLIVDGVRGYSREDIARVLSKACDNIIRFCGGRLTEMNIFERNDN